MGKVLWRAEEGPAVCHRLVYTKEVNMKDGKKDNNTEKTGTNYVPSTIICSGFTLCSTIEEDAKSSATEGSSPENVIEDPDTVICMHMVFKPVVVHLWVTEPLHP